MFKKLFLVLALAAMLIMPGLIGAGEVGQECTLLQGAKIIQMMPDTSLRPVQAPEDTLVKIVDHLTPDMVNYLNQMTVNYGMDWTGGHLVSFMYDFGNGQGPMELILIVKVEDMNCE